MGYVKETIEMVSDILDKNPNIKTMLELGNQYIFAYGNPEVRGFPLDPYPSGNVAKAYFERLGIEHTSVDYNGNDGALLIDLSKEVSIPGAPFDIITNFGTMEHVGEGESDVEAIMLAQYNGFKNIHDALSVGGILIGTSPKVGHWPGHCPCYYTTEFYKELFTLCKYDFLEEPVDYTYIAHPGDVDVLVRVVKNKKSKFISLEEFKQIKGHHIVL